MFHLRKKHEKIILLVFFLLGLFEIHQEYSKPRKIFIEDYIARYNSKDAEEIARYILVYSREHDIPPEVATGIFLQESKFNNQAISRVGALGISQLMPETAEELGVNPKDLRENIHGGIAYYKKMLNFNEGDLPKALASYNAGYGNVTEYNGIPPFPETQHYVRKVIANIDKLKKENVVFEIKNEL